MRARPVSVGIIANPSSGRDIRRLLGRASVFPTSEKINMVLRVLSAMGPLGVEEAWMIPDGAGLAAKVKEVAELEHSHRGHLMPKVRMLTMAVNQTDADSTLAARSMAKRGVRLIAVLGGDGTHRAVMKGSGSVPLATLSTGTNNAFPELREATLVGIASALVATGRVPDRVGLRSNKVLWVSRDDVSEPALVDVCVSRQRSKAARAVWKSEDLVELFTTFAESNAIGLSSIAGLAHPVSRRDPFGLHIRFGPGRTLLAPILSGALIGVSIASVERMNPHQSIVVSSSTGTIALDGEREMEFDTKDRIRIELDLHGPCTIAVEDVLAYAAQNGLLFVPNDHQSDALQAALR